MRNKWSILSLLRMGFIYSLKGEGIGILLEEVVFKS